MKKELFFAFGMIMIAFSCEKEVSINEELDSQEMEMISVTCTIDTREGDVSDSKVTLENDGSVGKTKWENTDEVLFRGYKVGQATGKTYYHVTTPTSISADGKTATFTIPVFDKPYDNADWNSTMFAAYPASALLQYDGSETSWYYITGFKETNHLLLAGYNNKTDASNGTNFTFQNLTGAISFKVDGDFDEYEFVGNNGETGRQLFCAHGGDAAACRRQVDDTDRQPGGAGCNVEAPEHEEEQDPKKKIVMIGYGGCRSRIVQNRPGADRRGISRPRSWSAGWRMKVLPNAKT